MFGLLLACLFPAALYGFAQAKEWARGRVLTAILAGYGLRIVLQTFLREIPLFSHGVGGDFVAYEGWSKAVVVIWEHTGLHYVTSEELVEQGATTLPNNVFGFIAYINGEPTRLGCTALIAFLACLTCLNLYRLALELGADETFSFRIMLILLFGPSFLMHTSEMFKDGMVAFVVVGALGSAFRLARKFSVLHAIIGVLCLVALFQVRYYLVFVTVGPLVVGLIGLNSGSIGRPLIAVASILAVGLAIATSTKMLENVSTTIETSYEVGTNQASLTDNANGGSGVTFDDGGKPFGALGTKLLYVLFAPFPWQAGSVGFQIGKLDALLWYYLAYRAFLASRRLFREKPFLLLMFLVFIVPTSVLYATGMSNIGLTVRERIPIVLLTGLLATLSKPKVLEDRADEKDDEERDESDDLTLAPSEGS